MNPLIINDVTGLNPTKVSAVFAPGSIEQLQQFIQSTSKPISIGGGRFSMGGQISDNDSLHIDMRGLNNIVSLDPDARIIRVQSGIRWRDIQAVIDELGLAIKIMQTYSDFTVGGSVSVNCHGRYMGLGPLVLSVRTLQVMMHDGELKETSPAQNPELFYGVVGGYGALGIITEVELDLAENTRVKRCRVKLNIEDYLSYFKDNVRNNLSAIFHNADLYPPFYKKASAVTWVSTEEPVTTKDRLNPGRQLYLAEKYFMWAITETPFGKWRREHIIDPLIYNRRKVHWRNYEAGYNVQELEPLLRDERTYVLQEYFIPLEHFLEFTDQMTEILRRHRVNVVNISVRHAHPDPGCYLAWARQESFAFVLYYKQRTRFNARQRVAVWTRELIDAALTYNGAYYLPYQPHATPAQFQKAYPAAERLFALKKRIDPEYRFRNCLWNKYYSADPEHSSGTALPALSIDSEFKQVYGFVESRDNFYRFLQVVYHLYPEDRFHSLIMKACEQFATDEQIYQALVEGLPGIKPFLSDFTMALPSLMKQKRVITAQTARLLNETGSLKGYLEIGSTGRYVRSLCKACQISGPIYLSNDNTPGYSPADLMERGQLKKIGRFFPLNNYEPIPADIIKDQSLDVVSCYIGLHHCDPDIVAAYVQSIHRVLRPGGVFILRDHNADSDEMKVFCSLVHTVFNAGLGVGWRENQQEPRYFNRIHHWVNIVTAQGFEDTGNRILQEHDPSLNTLMMFRKLAT